MQILLYLRSRPNIVWNMRMRFESQKLKHVRLFHFTYIYLLLKVEKRTLHFSSDFYILFVKE